GVRVMKQSDDEHPSAASRDWELKTPANGLHHAIGGKLTSAREDAAVIVDAVCEKLGVDVACTSRARMLPWAPEKGFAGWASEATGVAQGLGIDEESALWLMRRHGSRVTDVFDIVRGMPQYALRIVPEVPLIYADLLLCAREEMVVHLPDLLRRRMPLLILAKLDAETVRHLAELVAPVLGWDVQRISDEVEACHT
ncbi:MAG: glycerol-3-phosphate dehydrogenase C-terminal domain-containing protein, partial [Sideroxydans sp.]|nr:glycerol-3-phosphate dehydrogenase C-terminal domain-containing protein [Sideroxydans sp.]